MALKKKKRTTKKKATAAKRRPAKKNPSMKTVTGSTGWIKADAVRFVKRKGQPVQVLVKRSKRTKKRGSK